jgi:hypothetical protein
VICCVRRVASSASIVSSFLVDTRIKMNTASKLGPPTQTDRGTCPVWSLSLLQKPLHYRGVHLNSCPAFVYVGLGKVTARARILIHELLGRGARPLLAAALVVRRRYLVVVPRPMPAAPRRYLIVKAARSASLVERRRYLIVVPRPMPAAARKKLIVVPRPLPAAPLVAHRRYLVVAPGRCPRRRSL